MLMAPHNLQYTRFFPNVSPGYKITETPVNLVYLPITSDTINNITDWLTDQNGKELDLRGEKNINQISPAGDLRFLSCSLKNDTIFKSQNTNIRKTKRRLKKCDNVSIRLNSEDLDGEDVIAVTKSQCTKWQKLMTVTKV